jgi:uncharacterized iron-regulated membrane protein
VFQLHLWTGLSVGVYILMISVTTSILVYRDELFRAATRPPLIVKAAGPPLTDQQLRDAATASTVGLSRESRFSRACRSAIVVKNAPQTKRLLPQT